MGRDEDDMESFGLFVSLQAPVLAHLVAGCGQYGFHASRAIGHALRRQRGAAERGIDEPLVGRFGNSRMLLISGNLQLNAYSSEQYARTESVSGFKKGSS